MQAESSNEVGVLEYGEAWECEGHCLGEVGRFGIELGFGLSGDGVLSALGKPECGGEGETIEGVVVG